MGLKLEFLLLAIVAGLITMAMTVKISNAHKAVKKQTRELDFTDTTTIEVDTNKTLSITYASKGVRDAGVLSVNNLRYHTDEILLLKSKKAKFIGDKIYLDHNVTLHKEAGSDYYTEHAVFNKKSGILNVTAPFKAFMDKNMMYGDTLRYDTKKKKAFATHVDAVVFTAE